MKITSILTVEIPSVEVEQAKQDLLSQDSIVKRAVREYAIRNGAKLDDAAVFTLNSDGSVTIASCPVPVVVVEVPGHDGHISITIPPLVSPTSPNIAVTPVPSVVAGPAVAIPKASGRARCDKFTREFTFPAEGITYENVPGDNGGPTKYGIDLNGHPLLNEEYIRNMTEQQALDQYWLTWQEQKIDSLPYPIGEVVHDTYESGGQPIRWLQQTLNEPDPQHAIHWLQKVAQVDVDGMLGPFTLGAVEAVSNPAQIAHDFLILRDAYFNGLADRIPHDAQFRQGWLNRDIKLRKYLGV